MDNYRSRIDLRADVRLGKPVIRGTKITVEHILREMSEGMTSDELVRAHPNLETRDILAALAYSADVMSNE